MGLEFNEDFKNGGEKPRYIHKRNPLVPHAFQIFEFKDYKGVSGDYEPIGEYTVLDMDEDEALTELKLGNLTRIMNGKQDLMSLQDKTQTRLLFNMVPRKNDTDPTKIIFRTFDGNGVSTENAILELEKGVFDDNQSV